MHRTILRRTAATCAFALLVAACGQKPGVFVDDPMAGGGTTMVDVDGDGVPDDDVAGELDTIEDDEALATDEAEDPDGPDTGSGGGAGQQPQAANGGGAGGNGGGASQPRTSSGGNGGNGGSGGNGGNGGSGGNGGNGGQRAPQGSDRTGVSDDTITVAIHAPITGAAPLPATSFQAARQTYWRHLKAQGIELPGGRDVEVIFEDDRFAPDVARQVCRQLAARAYVLVGGGGSDGIQACGQLAQQVRIPYLSPGTTEAGLDDNPWYFAASMSYKQQGPLLAQLVKKRFPGKRVAAVIHNTPNVNDGIEGWEAGVRAEGLDYFRTLRSERSANPNFGPIVQQLQQEGVEVVHVLMSPLNYIQFAQTANNQGLDLQYVGYGITKGLNAVLNSGCPDVDGGIFFSPFPALETADRIDPDFRKASQRFDAPADDIAFAIWALNKSLHEMFDRYGKTFGDDMTREDLRAMLENTGPIETGVFPRVEYSPSDHFGGTAVHVLEANCNRGQYLDAGTFETGF